MGCQQSKPSKTRRRNKVGKRQKSKSSKRGKRRNSKRRSSKNERKRSTDKPAQQQVLSPGANVSGTNYEHKIPDLRSENLPAEKQLINQQNLPEEKHVINRENLPEEKHVMNYQNSGNVREEGQVINQQNTISEKFPVSANSQYQTDKLSVVKENEAKEAVHHYTGSPLQIPEASNDPATKATLNVNGFGSPERQHTNLPVHRESKSENYHNAATILPSTKSQKSVNSTKGPPIPYERASAPHRETAHDNDDASIPSEHDLPSKIENSDLPREPEQISNHVTTDTVSHPNAKSKESNGLQRQSVESNKGADIAQGIPYTTKTHDPPTQITRPTANSKVYTSNEFQHQKIGSKKGADSTTEILSNKGAVTTTGIANKANTSVHQEVEDFTAGFPYKTNISADQGQLVNDPYARREEPDVHLPKLEESAKCQPRATGNICYDPWTGQYKFYQRGLLIGYVDKAEAEKICKRWPICNGTDAKFQNDWGFQNHENQGMNSYPADVSYLNQTYSTVSQTMPEYRGYYM